VGSFWLVFFLECSGHMTGQGRNTEQNIFVSVFRLSQATAWENSVQNYSQIAWPGTVLCCWRSYPSSAGEGLHHQETPSWCVFSRCLSHRM